MRFLLEDAECAGGSSPFRGSWGFPRMRALRWGGPRGQLRPKLAQGRLADDGAPLHAAVVLGRRERVSARELGESDPAVEAKCLGGSDGERVEPDPRSNPSRAETTVTKSESHHAVRHPGQDPDGNLERASREIETDHILARKTERLGSLRAHERGVVPRELGKRIGKLLQPSVVREAPVVQRGGRKENDLQ